MWVEAAGRDCSALLNAAKNYSGDMRIMEFHSVKGLLVSCMVERTEVMESDLCRRHFNQLRLNSMFDLRVFIYRSIVM